MTLNPAPRCAELDLSSAHWMDSLEKHRRRVVTAWMQHFSSCSFAAHFAKGVGQPEDRIVIATYERWQGVPSDLFVGMDAMLENLGAQDKAALLIFPGIDREDDVVGMLRTLVAATGRWSMKPLADADPVPPPGALDDPGWSAVQRDGFGSLPVDAGDRRMPYVGLALWPGKKAEITRDLPGVSFRDMPSRLQKKLHRAMITQTLENVDQALGRARTGELFAFRLPRRVTGS